MKTQRMDAEHKRLKEEIERRNLQRQLHYDNKRETHKKLYSRVLAKNLLEGIESTTMKLFTDLSYFRNDIEENVQGEFYDWLVASTVAQIDRKSQIENAVEKLCAEPPKDYEDAHYHYLNQEHKRLEKIRTDEENRLMRLAQERAQRRHRRQLLRVERSKRKLKDEIEAKVISKRTIEAEILGLKVVSFSDDDTEMKKFRTYGGFLYELWAVASNVRVSLNKRVETPFEKFLLDDDQKKFVIHLLAENSVKDKGIRVTLHEKYKHEVDDALHLMDNDLFAFNENKDQIINSLVDHDDLLVGLGVELCVRENLFDKEVLKSILRGILRVYFKSNNYKVQEEPKPAGEPVPDAGNAIGEPKTQSADPLIDTDPQLQGSDVVVPPVEPVHHEDPVVSGHPAGPAKRVVPEITEEDKKIESLKKKLDIVFKPSELEQALGGFACVFRVRESLNRGALRPEVKQRQEEEELARKEEASKHVDPKMELKYHGKQYLLDEYLGQLKKEEEARKLWLEEEEAKKQAEYIEKFYGDTYDKELEAHDFEEGERPATNINEGLWTAGGQVLFIHRVNQGLLRKELLAKMRETFKELSLLKDINLEQDIFPVDRHLEQTVLQRVVSDPEAVPVFDLEL